MTALPELVDIPTIGSEAGRLSVVEPRGCLPFVPARLYYLYLVPPGIERGAHSHKELEQFMVCMSGSFRVSLEGKGRTFEFELGDPSVGLYIPPGYWRMLRAFSANAVCAVLASNEYDEDDYIRDYDEFKRWDSTHAGAVL